MRSPSRFALLAFCLATLGSFAFSLAQQAEPTAEEKKELLANQRFEEILKRKPRPGTALDRVYEFHISRGSLDQFCESLRNEANVKNSGQAALLLGLIQNQRGSDGEARTAFEKAEELLPQEPLASYYLGKTLLLIGDSEAAVAALQRAIDRKPEKADSLQIFQELGRVYQRLRRAEDALNVWKRMEAMFPGDLQVQEQIANVLEEEGANAAALERFTALAAATKDRFRQVELGVRAAAQKIKLNQHPEALKDFESLLAQINPGSWLHQDIRRRIDESFQSRQDTAGLTAYYQRWIDNHPEDVDAMMRIGRLLSIAHNSSAAKEWFNRAITRAPSAVEPRLALVEALDRDGNASDAATAMQALSELQPDNPDYLVRWGELLLSNYRQPEAQRAAAAADVWRKLLDKNADNPVMVSRVADLMRSANLSDEAIKLYTRAVELADSEPQYREYLGEYLHRLGRQEEALKVWRELASDTRKTRDNLVRLSEVLSTFGIKDEALTVMGQACQMQPTFGHRLRYSEKLIDATKYADAAAQLQLASQQAASEEEQDQVLEQEIKLHLASGELAKQIEQLENEIAQNAASKNVASWKRLALYQETDGKTQQALNSINAALKLAPQSAALLNMAARIQEKAGLMGDAVASLRKLIALDRRGQSRVLMQIAAMYVRLGQMDQAIKTAQEMLAAADAGTEQYRYYADLCFQAGKVEQGLDALRRNMRSNPNDREAIELLARALSNNFKTDEAIELTWRSFAKAANTADKTQNIQTLAELYLRSNSFDDLVKRLEVYGREENRGREAVVLTAAAHQASGDLAAARQLLEPLLTTDSRDSELLNTLIELARADGDWDAAANYQTKLNNLSPTPEGGMQLAKFLLEKGDIEQAESIWKKYAGQKMSADDMQNNMRQLLLSGETDKVLGMIDRALKNSPDDWEVLAVCMQMLVRAEKDTQAKELAEKILKLKLPRETLSENAKRQRSRQASNPQGMQNATRPFSSSPFASTAGGSTSTDRSACINRAVQMVQLLNMERTNPMVAARQMGMSTPSLVCYGDARLIALYLATGVMNQSGDQYQRLASTLPTETDTDKLWDAAFLMNFGSATTPGMQPGMAVPSGALISRLSMSSAFGVPTVVSTANGRTITYYANSDVASGMRLALKRLAELDDREAQLTLVSLAMRQLQTLTSLRQMSAMQMGQVAPPNAANLDPKTLDENLALFKSVQTQPGIGKNEQVLVLAMALASELKRADRKDEWQALLPFIKEHTRNVPKLPYANALVSLDPDAAVDIFLAAMKSAPSNNTSASNAASISNQMMETSNFLSELLDQQQAIAGLETESVLANLNRSNPLRLIVELKKLQAEKARRMRPSQLSTYTPSDPVRFVVRNARGNTMAIVPFPAASALQSSELLMAMYLIHQFPNNRYRDQLDKLLRAEAAQADDDAMQSAVDHLCLAVWLWWGEEREAAIKEMEVVRQTAAVNDLASMLASRMYFETGRYKEAIAQLESLKPTTGQLMQERELAILQLASQSGETALAKQAAERLFAMRLPPQTQMQVANLMQQLGMTEMAGSMMQRVQRRGGNQVATLAQLMSQYKRENKTSAAQEIARQILRRTRSNRAVPTSTGAQPANASLRRQALQLLADAPETKEQITQLEEKIKNNPKSTSLIYQLAELYEATGRASEASELLAKQQGTSRAAAMTSVANRLNTFRQTRSVESVKGYLEIFEKNPEMMEREYQYFQMSASQNNGWDTVAKTIAEWPIETLTKTRYGFNMIQQAIMRGSSSSVEKLLKKLLESDDFMTRFGPAFMMSGKRMKWSEDTQSLITEHVCKALADPAFLQTNPNPAAAQVGTAFGGRGSTPLTAVNNLIAAPQAAKKVLDTISPLSADRPQLKCIEVLMQLTADDRPAATKTLEQIQAWPLTEDYIQPTWELAGELMTIRDFELATPLFEHIVGHYQDRGLLDNTPKAQLLSCYEATRSYTKAKPLLDEYFAELQKQPPAATDPFGGGRSDVQSIIRVGERYMQGGYQLEALSVVHWIRGQKELITAVEAMYGVPTSNNPIMEQLNRLENQAKEKLDAKSLGQLLTLELLPQTSASENQKLILPVAMFVPEINSGTKDQTQISCQLRDLLSRLNEVGAEKTSVKQTLDGLAQDKWQGMGPRNLLCAIYLADFLQQPDDVLSAARQLSQRFAEEEQRVDKTSKAKEVEDAKAIRGACWLVAEKLIQKGEVELAQELVKRATALDTATNMKTLHMQLRFARSLKDAKQPAAAEKQMQELLEQLYPPKADQAAAAKTK